MEIRKVERPQKIPSSSHLRPSKWTRGRLHQCFWVAHNPSMMHLNLLNRTCNRRLALCRILNCKKCKINSQIIKKFISKRWGSLSFGWKIVSRIINLYVRCVLSKKMYDIWRASIHVSVTNSVVLASFLGDFIRTSAQTANKDSQWWRLPWASNQKAEKTDSIA